MRKQLPLLLAMCLTTAGIASLSSAASASGTTVMVISHIYQAEQVEGARILDWIAARSPDRVPIGRNGVVTVERMSHFIGAIRSASDTPLPPGGLPETGHPGGQHKVENTLPDGTRQSWSYRWVEPSSGHGGRWDLTGYTYRMGHDFPTDPR
ncbi:hypothetical protein [Stenotrophomonas sp. P5_B8]